MPRPATRNGITCLGLDRWQWRVMVDGVRYSGVATSEAAAKLARARAEIDAGGIPAHDPTVAELLAAHMTDSDRAETTRDNWRWAHDCLPEPFLNRRAADVTPPIVAALWRQLRGEPPHRLIKLANLCSTAWQEALKLGTVPANPFRVIPPPTPPRAAEIRPPDPADVRRLIDAADPWFRLWLLIATQTGARGGEVCGLQWDDLDPVSGEVVIRRNVTRTGRIGETKTGLKGQRRIALDDDTLEAWHEQKERTWLSTTPATASSTTAARTNGSSTSRITNLASA